MCRAITSVFVDRFSKFFFFTESCVHVECLGDFAKFQTWTNLKPIHDNGHKWVCFVPAKSKLNRGHLSSKGPDLSHSFRLIDRSLTLEYFCMSPKKKLISTWLS